MGKKEEISSKYILFSLSLILTLMSCENYYFSQAKQLESEGKYEEAIVLLDKAIQKNHKNLYALINRGAYKSFLEDYKGSIEDCTKVIEIDSINALAYLNRGNSKANLGNYTEAIEDYNKALKIKGVNENADGSYFYFEFADNLFIKKKTSDFDVTIEEIRLERGFARYHIDSLIDAFNDFYFCAQKNYDSPTSYYMVGLIYLACGDREEAYLALNKSRILGNPNAQEMINKYFKK